MYKRYILSARLFRGKAYIAIRAIFQYEHGAKSYICILDNLKLTINLYLRLCGCHGNKQYNFCHDEMSLNISKLLEQQS